MLFPNKRRVPSALPPKNSDGVRWRRKDKTRRRPTPQAPPTQPSAALEFKSGPVEGLDATLLRFVWGLKPNPRLPSNKGLRESYGRLRKEAESLSHDATDS